MYRELRKIMKKLFSLLVMAILFHSSSDAKLLKYLLGIDIDLQMGQNKVIEGKRYECIEDGFCRLRISGVEQNGSGDPLKWESVEASSLAALTVPRIVIDQEDGGLYVALSSSYASNRPEFSGSYTTTSVTEISPELIMSINEKIREVNSNANLFQGISEGKLINVIEQDGVKFVKLN